MAGWICPTCKQTIMAGSPHQHCMKCKAEVSALSPVICGNCGYIEENQPVIVSTDPITVYEIPFPEPEEE